MYSFGVHVLRHEKFFILYCMTYCRRGGTRGTKLVSCGTKLVSWELAALMEPNLWVGCPHETKRGSWFPSWNQTCLSVALMEPNLCVGFPHGTKLVSRLPSWNQTCALVALIETNLWVGCPHGTKLVSWKLAAVMEPNLWVGCPHETKLSDDFGCEVSSTAAARG